MPKRSTGPRYYPSRRGYYVWHSGRQHRLAKGSEGGDTLRRAWAAYWDLAGTPLRRRLRDIRKLDEKLSRVVELVHRRLTLLACGGDTLERAVQALGITSGELADCIPWQEATAGGETPEDVWARGHLGDEEYGLEFGRTPGK